MKYVLFTLVITLFQLVGLMGLVALPYAVFWIWEPQFLARYRIAASPRPARLLDRELWRSLQTVGVWTLQGVFLFFLYEQGWTQIDLGRTSWAYAILSFTLLNLFNDTYFYWTHRALHELRFLKKYHLAHHESRSPSPWTALSFHPVEAAINFGFFVIFAMVIPVHPGVLAVYYLYLLALNVNGHLGFELFPQFLFRIPFAKYFNNSSHHQIHHASSQTHFGLFYDFWDKLCGTENPGYREAFARNSRGQSSVKERILPVHHDALGELPLVR